MNFRKSKNRQSGSIISHHPLISSHQSTISDLSSITTHQSAVISGHSSVINHQSSVVSTNHYGHPPPCRSISRPQMVRKIMNVHPIRVPVHPHGRIIGPKEVYRLQEAFQKVPGPPRRQNGSKRTKKRQKYQSNYK